jgi:hypothetical protein
LNRFVLLVIILIVFTVTPVLAESVSLDKQSYVYGDIIKISGKISVVKGQFVGLQILNPSKSDIVTIDQFLPNNDGSFSKSYKGQGPKWKIDGIYTIKIVYGDQTYEKTFSFKKEIAQTSENPSNSSGSAPITPNQQYSQETVSTTELDDPKTRVSGFPDPHNSPKNYLDRYYNEQEFKNWFDNTFPGFTIEQVVRYPSTHITDFPDNELSPWYYVERYNNEEIFRDWFDSQFPHSSIDEILGYPDSAFQKVPIWIKNNAKWWASGLINDSDFLNGIEYMIKENIIIITELPQSTNSISEEIPSWVKNTARWWADDLIEENDFVKGIQFLVQNGIISV